MNQKFYVLCLGLAAAIFLNPAKLNAQSWSLTGNAGTDPSTNFVGTTDGQPLIFKVLNVMSGRIDLDSNLAVTSLGFQCLAHSTGALNTAVGYNAMLLTTTGKENAVLGSKALYTNTIGYGNSSLGSYTLYSNTNGKENSAVGYGALYSNNVGSYNTAIGTYALYSSGGAYYNTATGYKALYKNTFGTDNVANGSNALYSNTGGSKNTASGSKALYANTTGESNTANGYLALTGNTAGIVNTAVGTAALFSNTIGNYNTANGGYALSKNVSGNLNTASGYDALLANTSGSANTATGNAALSGNTSGHDNTASGVKALNGNTTGLYNTADGNSALSANTTGSYNTAVGRNAGITPLANNYCTYIGRNADASAERIGNATAIGNGSKVDGSNQVRIGNSSVNSIGGYVGWTDLPSDIRFKKNIKDNVPGLSFINQLRTVTYNVDVKKLRSLLGEKVEDERDPEAGTMIQKGIEEKEKIVRTGFIAQQVEEAAKKIGYDFSGVDKPANENSLYGLRYAEFVVPLVKAVQELSHENDELKKQNAEILERLEKLEASSEQSKLNSSNTNSTILSLQSKITSDASLGQNVPNPFAGTTSITYSLPSKYSSAQILISDKSGKSIKQINLTGTGKGIIQVDVSTLASGTYHYAMYVDGKMIGSKQMEHIK